MLRTVGEAVLSNDTEDARVALDLLDHLADVVTSHGPDVARTTLRLHPIALARGDSKQQLDEWLDRVERGLCSGLFASYNPKAKRFPVEIVETGSVALSSLALSA